MGKGNRSGLESFAQGVRHSLGIAEIAHGVILCIGERNCQGLALLTRSLGQRRPGAARYVHRTRKGASSGSYLPVENMHRGDLNCQSSWENLSLMRSRRSISIIASRLQRDSLRAVRSALQNHSASSGHGTMVDFTVFIAMASATARAMPSSENGYSVCMSSQGYLSRVR